MRKLVFILLLLPSVLAAQERGLLPVVPSPVAPVNGDLRFPARMFRLTMVPSVDTSAESWQYVGQGANIGIGFKVLPDNYNTTGYTNIAIGGNILRNAATDPENNTASDNIAMGWNALNDAYDASYNIALGNWALGSVRTAGRNVAVGDAALSLLGYGYYDAQIGFMTAVGYEAGRNVRKGRYGTFFGHNADAGTSVYGVTTVGAGARAIGDSLDNAAAYGFNAIVRDHNTAVIGDTVDTKVVIGKSYSTTGARLEVHGAIAAIDAPIAGAAIYAQAVFANQALFANNITANNITGDRTFRKAILIEDGDSVTISVEGVSLKDVITLGYMMGKTTVGSETALSWYVWEEDVLTIYGVAGRIVNYIRSFKDPSGPM